MELYFLRLGIVLPVSDLIPSV